MFQFTSFPKPFILLFFISLGTIAFAQKKPLDHSAYDSWKSLQNISVSDDGRFVGAIISPQEGDSILFVRDLKKNQDMTLKGVNRFILSSDGKYTVGLIKAPFSDRREARIKKKKAEEMPKDSLVIIRNDSFNIEKIAGVKSYKTAEKMASHVAYIITQKADTTGGKSKEKPKDLLVIRNIATQQEDTIRNAKDYIFNKFENSLAAIIEPEKKDSTDTPGVLFYDLQKNISKRISNEKAEYKSLAFDENGEQLLYLATRDTSKIAQKVFDVRYFKNGNDSAIVLADKNSTGLPEKWIFNEFSAPRFSKNGERVILGAAPQQAPKDTTIVDFETASLDIWHWQDPLVQPQQLVELRNKQRRTYTGIILPDQPNRFTSIANEKMPFCSISDEGNGPFALLWSNEPYQLQSQWDISSKNDVWVWDIRTGQRQAVASPVSGRPSISPKGNFVYWWDATKRQWFLYDNHSKTIRDITGDIPINFWDEKNDVPSDPGSYGIAGWGENDDYIFVNDAFDIWKIDPRGNKKPENITAHAGRNDSITFRYINTDPEKRFIKPGDLLLLSAFDRKTKQAGYYTLTQKGRNPLRKRTMEEFSFPFVTKAKEKDLYIFRKGNFNTTPDLYTTRDFWQSIEKLTDINPQMRDYNWGTAELFSWNSLTGIPHQGILYKPEDFDPTRKYPLMIYFYEQHSDNLYSYFSPAPSRSTINIPFFVSRGYIVFTPDIHYTTGQPGRDAYNSVVAGAEALAKNNWVDKENMAIQGQSWGGYQVAYLVTKTDMFKAAGAGAPVSNMTSAYGGIRWESGMSRQFQYEQTQSRIGVPMIDSLHLYIENSPVFYADKVNTPLLIMHNDKDGAVPWYQGIEYFMTLRRLGKPVWMLQYNNEAHNLNERRNAKDLSIRLQQFFDHYLKGDPAPVWMTKGVPATEKGKTWGYELDTEYSNSVVGDSHQQITTPTGRWQMVWNDEFNYKGLPDTTKWSYDTGGNSWGWGNNEAQHYTAFDPDNAYVDDGKLTITARIDSMGGKRYTSARIRTKGKGDWLYGRFEIRAKLPAGVGTWSAIWMLPSDNVYGGWPASGEIDIMENVGYDPDNIVSTAHTKSYNHVQGTQTSGYLEVPTCHSDFHLYALEWEENEYRVYVDDHLHYTFKNEGTGSAEWPFDQRFHLLLNLAIGGNWGGQKGIDDTLFPHHFLIDYVRVYQKVAP